MVRLKDAIADFTPVRRMFQFHYGTIKSARALRAGIASNQFQFHYGTIKRYTGCSPNP